MFMAIGTAGAITPNLAIAAAIFHLFTHAFFKALLFLGSGSVMHAMGGVIDVRKFGGLRHVMPITHATFLCGTAALAGLPVLSGFWSKDLIIDVLDEAGERAVVYRGGYWVVFGLALITAALTAFYSFRAYFLTFWGPERVPAEAGDHAHESPPVMTVPLIVLAIGAVFAGFLVNPFSHFVSESHAAELANIAYTRTYNVDPVTGHYFSWIIAGLSTIIAMSGACLAYVIYKNGSPDPVPESLRGLYTLSRNKLHVDEIYLCLIVKPAEVMAVVARHFDGFLDSLTRLVAYLPRGLANLLRPLQNGLVQFYALNMTLMLAALMFIIVFRNSR